MAGPMGGEFLVRCQHYTVDLPADAGSASDVIIEGAVVDSVSAALVELSHIHKVTAAVLEGGNALVLLHHAAWTRTSKMFTIQDYLEILQSNVPSLL